MDVEPTSPRGSGRRGNLVGIVLVVALGTVILTTALMDRSIRSGRAARWGRDHLVLQMLVDSAAEELFAQVSRGANRPGEPVFRALRAVPRGKFRPVDIRGLSTPVADESRGELQASLGADIRLRWGVRIHKLVPVGEDPIERCGVVRVEATATLSGLGRATESVRVDHSFRVSRVTPPRPLDEVGLFVGMSTPAQFPMLHSPDSVFAALHHGPCTLTDLYTCGLPDGLQVMARKNRPWMTKALGTFSPAALAARAHDVTTSAAALDAFLMARLSPADGQSRPVNGLIHSLALDPVHVAFPSFSGKCLLSFTGPVILGDIYLADPTRDCLTIVSADRILVQGHTIEAVLVNLWNPGIGIVFGQTATVQGAVLTSRFPGRSGIGGAEYAGCRIGFSNALDSGTRASGHPDDRLLVRYVALFSPHPIAQEHVRDRESWSSW